jgi:hypothetical protein
MFTLTGIDALKISPGKIWIDHVVGEITKIDIQIFGMPVRPSHTEVSGRQAKALGGNAPCPAIQVFLRLS